ncbi:uncharacterized protein JCM10292_001348 [Rhodotorula paludigena]|uniref:uncharacterized protein n=1 Tax=Rhodotorula paludigena TaxID=86838 RepID=UPI003179EF55
MASPAPLPAGADKESLEASVEVTAHSVYNMHDRTPEEVRLDRRVLLKTDLFVLTLLVVVATLEFLDKNALAYAAVFGLRADTNLVGQEYSWVASIFYFGYLAAVPACMFITTKVGPARLVGTSTTLWGIVLLCMAACHNYGGLLTVRFFLGVFEAAILPCYMALNSIWWRREEQALRTALWYNTFAGIFGGVLSYAIGHISGNLATWKYLFLIYGAVTVLFGILVIVILPTTPQTAWFFTQAERERVAIRLADNQQSKDTKKFRPKQIVEALKSPQYWLLVVFAVAQAITNAGITNFNPLIINGFGFSKVRTTLMATPQAAVLDHETQRGASLAGVYLLGFYNTSWVLALSLATSNTSGTTKKLFQSTSIAVAYAVGNIIGPQGFRADEAPTYRSGIIMMLACFSIMCVTGILYGLTCVSLNKRRDASAVSPLTAQELSGMEVDEDLTDRENPLFRYSY